MTPRDDRCDIARGSGVCGRDRLDRAARRRISGLLHRRSFGSKPRGHWRCASFAPSVSMSFLVIETESGRRSIDLRGETNALRGVVTAERRPIGSTDKCVRGVACTIRNTQVPVHPGRDTRLVVVTINVSVLSRSFVVSKKSKRQRARFSLALTPRPYQAVVLRYGDHRREVAQRWTA